MKTLIVVPMKDPAMSKQRLAGVLTPSERQVLATRLFQRTLDFFSNNFPEFPVLVVTSSANIACHAEASGAWVLMEEQVAGLNGAATMAAQWACGQGFDRQLLVPADIPELKRYELRTLLDSVTDKPMTAICRAEDGGTNALLTCPPDVIPFCFGPDSCLLHLDAAQNKGIKTIQFDLPYLAFDVDSPSDLEQIDYLPGLQTEESALWR